MAKKKKDDGLLKLIQQDQSLEDELKMEFMTLANSYTDDFRANLFRTSIELDDLYPFGIHTWSTFLNHPPIKKFIQGFVNELISKSADTALAGGDGVRDAINVRREIDKQTEDYSGENFVVFRLPDKVVFNG